MRNKNKQAGLIDTIVLIVVALIILGYFNIDLKTVFSEPLVKDNLLYAFWLIIDGIKYMWQSLRALLYDMIQA